MNIQRELDMPNRSVKLVPLVKNDVTIHELAIVLRGSLVCPGVSLLYIFESHSHDKAYCFKSVLFSRVTLIAFLFYVFKKGCVLWEILLSRYCFKWLYASLVPNHPNNNVKKIYLKNTELRCCLSTYLFNMSSCHSVLERKGKKL